MADEKKDDKKDDKKPAKKSGLGWEEVCLLVLALITIFYVVIPRLNPEAPNGAYETTGSGEGPDLRGWYDRIFNSQTEVIRDSQGQVITTSVEPSLVDEAKFRARDIFENVLYFFFFTSLFLSLLFGLILYHNKVRLEFIKKEYAKKMGLVKTPAAIARAEKVEAQLEKEALAKPDTNSVSNPRWELVEKFYNSGNQSDWRMAIIEADIMLYDLLDKIGLEGISIGDKLKNANRAQFNTLDIAWRAHRIRNDLAHQGSNFNLNRNVVETAVEGYRKVFTEFYYIYILCKIFTLI